MTKLSVNINKFATLRNSRGGNNPDVVKAAEATAGAPIKLVAFERFALGEGIEKQADDFAAEVAKAAGAA